MSTLTINIAGSSETYKVGYRVKDSNSAYTYISPDPPAGSLSVTVPDGAQYEVSVAGICGGGSLSQAVTTQTNGPQIMSPQISCRTNGTCNDNATCGVRFSVPFAYLDPAKTYTVLTATLGGSGPAIVGISALTQIGTSGTAQLSYSETDASQTVNFDIILYENGVEVDRLNQNLSHNSAFAFVGTCT